jgi:hypothetical protein
MTSTNIEPNANEHNLATTQSRDIENKNATSVCLNCDTSLVGNYCSYCGQIAETRLITLPNAFNNLFSHLTDLDNKVFVTIKDTLKNPGRTALNYVLGQRIKYVHPIKYFIVAMGLSLVVLSLLQQQGTIESARLELPGFINIPEEQQKVIVEWAMQYAHLVMLMLLPIYGFFLKKLFNNKRTTGEATVLIFYFYANLALLAIIFLGISQLHKSTWLEYIRSGLFIGYSCWAIIQFFEEKLFSGLWRIALAYLLYNLSVLALMIGIFKGYEIWLTTG